MIRRAVIVHSREHAEAALAAAVESGTPVALCSPRGAGGYMGAAMFRELMRAAREAHPDVDAEAVFDCGSEPGTALNALRHGIRVVSVDVSEELGARLNEIAVQLGARVTAPDPWYGDETLDLAGLADPLAACRRRFACPPGE